MARTAISKKAGSGKSRSIAKPRNRHQKKKASRPKQGKARVAAPRTSRRAYELPAVCDTAAADKLRADFLALRGNDVDVDASSVRRIGVLSLQVLLSAERTWRSDGKRLSIVLPTAELVDSVALLGLSKVMTNMQSVAR